MRHAQRHETRARLDWWRRAPTPLQVGQPGNQQRVKEVLADCHTLLRLAPACVAGLLNAAQLLTFGEWKHSAAQKQRERDFVARCLEAAAAQPMALAAAQLCCLLAARYVNQYIELNYHASAGARAGAGRAVRPPSEALAAGGGAAPDGAGQALGEAAQALAALHAPAHAAGAAPPVGAPGGRDTAHRLGHRGNFQ